jgi:hypothetical protein
LPVSLQRRNRGVRNCRRAMRVADRKESNQ